MKPKVLVFKDDLGFEKFFEKHFFGMIERMGFDVIKGPLVVEEAIAILHQCRRQCEKVLTGLELKSKCGGIVPAGGVEVAKVAKSLGYEKIGIVTGGNNHVSVFPEGVQYIQMPGDLRNDLIRFLFGFDNKRSSIDLDELRRQIAAGLNREVNMAVALQRLSECLSGADDVQNMQKRVQEEVERLMRDGEITTIDA